MPVPAASYQPTIPQATDQLSKSQGDILNNFGAIQTLIDYDHVDFSGAVVASISTSAGKHFRVTLPAQSPAPTFAGGDVGFYNFLNTVSGINELYVNKLNVGSVNAQVPMTMSVLSTIASPTFVTGQNGWTYLPSGILLKWGLITPTLPNPAQVIFPVAASIPVFNNVLSVQLTPYVVSTIGDPNIAAMIVGIPNATGFFTWTSPRTTIGSQAIQILYLAIGW